MIAGTLRRVRRADVLVVRADVEVGDELDGHGEDDDDIVDDGSSDEDVHIIVTRRRDDEDDIPDDTEY